MAKIGIMEPHLRTLGFACTCIKVVILTLIASNRDEHDTGIRDDHPHRASCGTSRGMTLWGGKRSDFLAQTRDDKGYL